MEQASLDRIISDADTLRQALDRRTSEPIVLLGEQLLSEGLITRDQLDKAIKIQRESKEKRIGEILVEAGAVDNKDIDSALAARLGVPRVDLRRIEIEPEAVKLVPNLTARRLVLMPCFLHRSHVVVATRNPLDHDILQALRFATGKYATAVYAEKEDVEWAIDRYYKELKLQET
jgi:type IV pilus assembly protein PilB